MHYPFMMDCNRHARDIICRRINTPLAYDACGSLMDTVGSEPYGNQAIFEIVHAMSTCPRNERGTQLPLASCVEAM